MTKESDKTKGEAKTKTKRSEAVSDEATEELKAIGKQRRKIVGLQKAVEELTERRKEAKAKLEKEQVSLTRMLDDLSEPNLFRQNPPASEEGKEGKEANKTVTRRIDSETTITGPKSLIDQCVGRSRGAARG